MMESKAVKSHCTEVSLFSFHFQLLFLSFFLNIAMAFNITRKNSTLIMIAPFGMTLTKGGSGCYQS